MPHREEQRRKQAIARYLADDKIEDICKAIGGSKSWLYKWRDRYQADDPHWAQELTRRPRTTPAKTSKTIEQAVVSLRHALCQNGQGCGAAAIQQGLAQHGVAAASVGKCAVSSLAQNITLWPGQSKAYNSWKIKTRT